MSDLTQPDHQTKRKRTTSAVNSNVIGRRRRSVLPLATSHVMRFQAPDGSSFIQLDRRDEDGYAIFDVTASIEGFAGRNPATGHDKALRSLSRHHSKI